MAKLIVEKGSQAGTEVEVKPGLVLGRRPELPFHLDDVKASREHAKIDMDGARFVLIDLESTNGTYLDGSRVSRARLVHGSRIRIGQTEMVFDDPGGASLDKPAAIQIDFGAPPPKKVQVRLKPTKRRRP